MKGEFNKDWMYRAGDSKPPYACPVCGMRECMYNYLGYSYDTRECYCTMCDSEWLENDKYWDTVQATGTIEEEA